MNGYEYEAPAVYADEFWDAEREEGWQAAEPAERLFAQGRAWDSEPAGAVLGMAVSRTAEGDLSGLSDDELLGAISANERVAGHHAWVANTLAAEYARRNTEWDAKAGQEVIGEFGEADYAQEIRTGSNKTATGRWKRPAPAKPGGPDPQEEPGSSAPPGTPSKSLRTRLRGHA